MALNWPDKDPNEVLDFTIDWSETLGADTISSSSWIVPSGITEDSDTNTATTTTIWLSGGTEDERYSLVNRIVTLGGRTFDQTVRIRVRTK